MIQVNLLPDLKREYLRSQQMKHIFVIGSVLISIVAVSLLALLFVYVQFIQPRHRVNLQKDIDDGIAAIKNTEDAVKIVTVQGALEQLPVLQNKKMISSRLFGQLIEFTPRNVAYNEVRLDLTTNTLNLRGQTSSLELANTLANNLKSAKFTYKKGETESSLQPFTNIVFSSLSKAEQPDDPSRAVSFEISFQVDPTLFAQDVLEGKISVNAGSEELILPTTVPFNESANMGSETTNLLLPGATQ